MTRTTKAAVLAVAQRAADLVGRVLATNREEQKARDTRALAEYARGKKERAGFALALHGKRPPIDAAVWLHRRADDFAREESEALDAQPVLRLFPVFGEYREARSIIRNEARRLESAASKPQKQAMRPAALRLGAGTREALEAFAVLEARAETLRKRIDRAYESTERAEVELETILEALEAAAHDTMDWTSDENGESQEDTSMDDDDADICFAESAARSRARGRTTNPLRPSATQARALGILPSGEDWYRQEETLTARRAHLVNCSQPDDMGPED